VAPLDSGVEFVAADMPHANKLTIHILAAVAEHEREAISARTKAALAVVKERLALEGKKLGSPKLAETRALGHAANRAKAAKSAANVLPIVEEAFLVRVHVHTCHKDIFRVDGHVKLSPAL
jgi:DNA invertase Pin-like site-specific DNA recombinase